MLVVEVGASPTAVRRAYRAAILVAHPDKEIRDYDQDHKMVKETEKLQKADSHLGPRPDGDVAFDFVCLTRAYEVLRDPVRRARYDAEHVVAVPMNGVARRLAGN